MSDAELERVGRRGRWPSRKTERPGALIERMAIW